MDNCTAEISETIAVVVTRPKKLRSATSNGNRPFVLGGDGRGVWVRRWRDLTELHVNDLGDPATLSEAQLSLCRRASTLEVQLEMLEAAMSEGAEVDLDQFGRLAGHLRRYFETLGLQRRMRTVRDSAVIEHFKHPPHRPVLGGRA
jgi:hypothetical protein